MEVALVLIAIASGSNAPAPAMNMTGPLVLGNFPSVDACETAARAAKITGAGTIGPGGPTGASFLCVKVK
jgi:hypothetical protein